MENITTLATSLGFDSSLVGDAEPILQIQPQQPHLDEQILSLESAIPIRPEGGDAGEGDPRLPASEAPENFAVAGDQLEPKLGIQFESSEDARGFYSAYAERLGFRVRNSKSFTSRVDDTVIMRRFVCSKQGRPSTKDPFDLTKKRRNRISSREGCKAMLQVNRRENGRWEVSRCFLEHCHPLGIAPKQSPAVQRKLARKPWDIIPCRFAEARQNGLGAGGGVAQSLLEYFKRMQAENPAFFYAIHVDSNNCLENVFWADARSRMAYSYFGDAIIFDMTCKKNKRVVPFAAFVGMNHHRHLITFGCTFMTDESEASFIWLFETWVSLMSGRYPVSLIIPFSDAIGAAAEKVFPHVRCRFCKRDIFNKCKENLSDVYSAHATFKSEFKKCVNESENVGEFESCWRFLISKYSLEGNIWLQSLYNIRQRWVPVFLRETFFAEISGAPELETMHKFFQRNSITTTTLRDIVALFDKAMSGQYEKEVHADFVMVHSRPVMKTPSQMEKQASEIYTGVIFDFFQEELVEASGFVMEKVEDGLIIKFRVTKVEDSSRAYLVTYNASEKRMNCSCFMYEFSGILCRHVHRVLMVIGAPMLTEDYILKRWTRNAKNNSFSYEQLASVPSNNYGALALRCNDLFRDAIRFAEEGAASAVMYKIAKEALQDAFNEVFATKRGPFFNMNK